MFYYNLIIFDRILIYIYKCEVHIGDVVCDFLLQHDHICSHFKFINTVASASIQQRIIWEPRGVVAHISAWNYPVLMVLL